MICLTWHCYTEAAYANDMASMLKRYGPKAVKVAHHFYFHPTQLVQEVLSELGYPEDWISSEEGRK